MKALSTLALALFFAVFAANPVCAADEPASGAATEPAPAWEADFSSGKTGELPAGWQLGYPNVTDAVKARSPRFATQSDTEGRHIAITGGGDPTAISFISTKIRLAPGAYTYSAVFTKSPDVNPQQHLLFQCDSGSKDGIFKFYKQENGQIEGRDTLIVSGEGGKPREVTLRVYYRFNAGGEVLLRGLSLTPAPAPRPLWVRFACTQGRISFEQIPQIAAKAAADKVDVLLFPEEVSQRARDASQGARVWETLSRLAAGHKMYVGASVLVQDPDGRKLNRGVLFDRTGKPTGTYDKIHPFSPETNEGGVAPGSKVEVFPTEFGKMGVIICYDSWFTDVTQLLALKGAKVILFPNAGYYRSLLHARAADNGVRFVVSTLSKNAGAAIFDTAGRDIQAPGKDNSVGAGKGKTFKDIRTYKVDNIGILAASLDLNCSPAPHRHSGRMDEAPGGKRNRADQVFYLEDEIKKERERWWEEP